MIRIGYGTDLHKLKTGLPLILGGVNIPSEQGSLAHSDGDVIIHAICDALLGALALGDIGDHFPDTDPDNKGESSLNFLKQVLLSVEAEGFSIGNIDITLNLEQPRITPYKARIRENLAAVLGIASGNLSLKAKTAEGLGHIGRSEAISAEVVVLLYS